MEEVNESIKFINEKFEEMEADRMEKERQIWELKKEVKSLNEKVKQWIGVWIAMSNILEETVFLYMVWKKTRKKILTKLL